MAGRRALGVEWELERTPSVGWSSATNRCISFDKGAQSTQSNARKSKVCQS